MVKLRKFFVLFDQQPVKIGDGRFGDSNIFCERQGVPLKYLRVDMKSRSRFGAFTYRVVPGDVSCKARAGMNQLTS